MTSQIIFLDTPAVGSKFFQQEGDDFLHKKALVLASGEWTDSKRNKHVFTDERVELIAENTNKALQVGKRIPILEDHQNIQSKTIGDVEDTVQVRTITEQDLPPGKFQHLVGRTGLFASQLVLKAERAIKDAKRNLINTISPGIDVISNTIREISVTPNPAIAGMTMFSLSAEPYTNFSAKTWEEMEMQEDNITPLKQEIKELCAKYCDLVEGILTSNEEELEGYTTESLLKKATADYAARLLITLGITKKGRAGEDGYDDLNNEAQQAANKIMERTTGPGYPFSGYSASEIKAAKAIFSNPTFDVENEETEMAEFRRFRKLKTLLGKTKKLFGPKPKTPGLVTASQATKMRRLDAARKKARKAAMLAGGGVATGVAATKLTQKKQPKRKGILDFL